MCASSLVTFGEMLLVAGILVLVGRLWVIARFREGSAGADLSANLLLPAMAALLFGSIMMLLSTVAASC